MSLKKYEDLLSRERREFAKLYITKEDAKEVAGVDIEIREYLENQS